MEETAGQLQPSLCSVFELDMLRLIVSRDADSRQPRHPASCRVKKRMPLRTLVANLGLLKLDPSAGRRSQERCAEMGHSPVRNCPSTGSMM